jgi:hypothetical protein
MVPVDVVAHRITEEVLVQRSSGIRYKNIAGSRVSTRDLDEFIGTQIEDSVEVIPMHEWDDRAKALGLREDLGEWFVAMASGSLRWRVRREVCLLLKRGRVRVLRCPDAASPAHVTLFLRIKMLSGSCAVS